MLLINNDNANIIDTFGASLSNIEFNRKKFSEIISLSNISLEKQFSYHNSFTNEKISEITPLFYPYSTLLLATGLNDDLTNYCDHEMATYIWDMLHRYDPYDFRSIYDIVSADKNIKDLESPLLSNYLNKNNKDIEIFREIFNHIDFTYYGSCMSGFRNYFKTHADGGIFPKFMYDSYNYYEGARENSKVIELLKLKPNKIN